MSLCPLAGVGQGLFTYEGSGTLCTRAEYCQIEKLGIDDFHEVERLLQRAEQAGYLKPRTPPDMARAIHKRIAASELLVLPGSMHCAVVEDADTFLGALLDFLSRN